MLHVDAHRVPQRPELVAPVEDLPSWLQPFDPKSEEIADDMTLEELAGQHLQRSRQDTLMQADSSRTGSGPEASVMPVPAAPTAKQRAEHAITHLPYQPWCPDCVSGKGIEAQHRQSAADTSAERVLQIDYAFYGSAAQIATDHEAVRKVIVAVDVDTGLPYQVMCRNRRTQ